MWELDPPQQVGSQQSEDDNPQGEEHFAVEDVPAVSEVGYAEELQGKGEFDESQHNLDGVHPSARLGCLLEQRREQGEEGKRYGQRNGEAQHADGGSEDGTLRGHGHEEESDDGTCARERHQRQREGHEEDGEQSCGAFRFGIDLRRPRRGQRQFEGAEEGCRKYHQQQTEQDVEYGIGGEGVEGAGTKEQRDRQTQQDVDDDDAQAVNGGLADGLRAFFVTFQEERYGHGDDGPYAGGKQGEETAQQSFEEYHPQGDIGGVGRFAVQCLQFANDGLPEGVGRCRRDDG